MKASREDAKHVLSALRTRGFESYLAGGCVRDLILGLEPNDFDVTTQATPEEVQSTFSRTIPVGASFGVVKVVVNDREIDVATFRSDGKYSDNRRPDQVTYSKSAEEDVMRRDFTINGLLMDEDGKILDYVNGQQDLKNGILRTIGTPEDRFGEDSLRMLRAIRFSTRFNLRISPFTWAAIETLADTVKNVSKERVTEELSKTFSYGSCDIPFWMLHKSGLWRAWFGDEGCGHTSDNYRAMFGLAKVNPGEPFILPLAIILYPSYTAVKVKVRSCLALTNDQSKGLQRLFDRGEALTQFMSKALHDQRRMMDWEDIDLVRRLITCLHEGKIAHYRIAAGISSSDVSSKMAEIKSMGFPEPLVDGNDLQAMGYVAGPIFTKMLSTIQNHQLDGDLTREGVEEFLLANFPAAPKMVDGRIVDGMGPHRLVAECKKCSNTMSFEIKYDERGVKQWNTTDKPIGVSNTHSGKFFECKECSTRRAKTSFQRAIV